MANEVIHTVIVNGQQIMTVRDTTANQDVVEAGYVFYDKSGNKVTGQGNRRIFIETFKEGATSVQEILDGLKDSAIIGDMCIISKEISEEPIPEPTTPSPAAEEPVEPEPQPALHNNSFFVYLMGGEVKKETDALGNSTISTPVKTGWTPITDTSLIWSTIQTILDAIGVGEGDNSIIDRLDVIEDYLGMAEEHEAIENAIDTLKEVFDWINSPEGETALGAEERLSNVEAWIGDEYFPGAEKRLDDIETWIGGDDSSCPGAEKRIQNLEEYVSTEEGVYKSVPRAINADMVDGKHADEFATAEQGLKADNAVEKDKLENYITSKEFISVKEGVFPEENFGYIYEIIPGAQWIELGKKYRLVLIPETGEPEVYEEIAKTDEVSTDFIVLYFNIYESDKYLVRFDVKTTLKGTGSSMNGQTDIFFGALTVGGVKGITDKYKSYQLYELNEFNQGLNIERGAQVNKIEGVKINDKSDPIEIKEKIINLGFDNKSALDKITEDSLKDLMDRISQLEEQAKYMFLQPQGSKISIGARVFGNMKDSESPMDWSRNIEGSIDGKEIYRMLESHANYFTVPKGWIMNIELITNLKTNDNGYFDDIGTDTIGVLYNYENVILDLTKEDKEHLDNNSKIFILATSNDNYKQYARKKIQLKFQGNEHALVSEYFVFIASFNENGYAFEKTPTIQDDIILNITYEKEQDN